MKISEKVPLAPLTTLRIGGPARYLIEVASESELTEALTFAHDKNLPIFILGGGSNVLVSDQGFDGLVIQPKFTGISVHIEDTFSNDVASAVIVVAGAGEVLDDVISKTVDMGLWGLENMSFVPGTVGGAIIQNAGCYGQEIGEVVEGVHVYDRKQDEFDLLSHEQCHFTYRHSVFNTSARDRYIILSVNLRLSKEGTPDIKYKDLQNFFGDRVPSQKELREAVIEIRKSKGQDPREYWTAGSFFSNFKLSKSEFDNLCSKIKQEFGSEKASELRDLVNKIIAPSDQDKIKVPAAWILDQLLRLKGTSVGGAMLSKLQVLNVLNTGHATATDCVTLFHKVRNIVRAKTGLILVTEPEFVGML
ncbi:MAG TPA: UDP-N-acetylmuramate dehydrogenase [Candidatus Paceibacterota bacterium]